MKKNIVFLLLITIGFLPAQTESGTYTIKNLEVNTELSDFGTSYYGKDKIVFSSPRSKKSLTRNVWLPNNQPYLDLYVGLINYDGEITNKQKLFGTINSKFHEAQVAFTNDLKTVYFTRNNYFDKKERNNSKGVLKLQLCSASVNENGEWTNITKLPFNSDEYSSGHPALSNNNKKLYFISDRPESLGNTDIFVVDIYDNGTFSEPKNLGPRINTKGKEVFPFISSDGLLYFSSDGHKGNGSLDVFASKITETAFSQPVNLGSTINSKKDDFAFVLNNENSKGYFSSNRKNGKGDDDIYSFRVVSPINIICKQLISGITKDESSGKIIGNAQVSIVDLNGEVVEESLSNANGIFEAKIPCDTSYKIIAGKKGFIDFEKSITTADDYNSRAINISFNLIAERKESEEQKININPIYFDLNSWEITSKAARELDKVVDFMTKNPEVFVESRSHTDSRGQDRANLLLSDKRAKSTVDYIISQGIEPNRISSKGYGETQLLNECANFVKCTSAQHQENRRTEFVVINKE